MTDVNEYDFELPRELIAQTPLAHRADARLLIVDRQSGKLEEAHVRDLAQFLRPPDCIVFNDTRVIPARLVGRRDRTGGRWEGLFLESDSSGFWRILSKTRGKLQPAETVTLQKRDSDEGIALRMVSQLPSGEWLALPEDDGEPFDLLMRVGRVPLPPYIRGGEMRDEDVQRYQTVFASRPGAIAAPTAGLHFTGDLLGQLKNHGVGMCRVTLHVGAGTFRPITSDQLEQHAMHAEWGELDDDTAGRLTRCRDEQGRIVAIGTTVVRVLETAAAHGPLQGWSGKTDLFIRPPYSFKAVDVLLTNFHLPRSTLLVLVRTFGGDELIRQAYEYAIRERFRFFSYGDAMLII